MDILIDGAHIIVAAGIDFEARIAKGNGTRIVYGQDRETYLMDLQKHVKSGAAGIVSFGTSGGIAPQLKAGDVVVADSIVTSKTRHKTSEAWSQAICKALPHANHMPIFGAQAPVLTVIEKEALWSATGVAAVDMESRLAAEVAEEYGLPHVVVRVVLDPAHRAVPLSALAGVEPNGRTSPAGVIQSLAKRPHDLLGIIRLAGDTRKASAALRRTRQTLGPLFGFSPLNAGALTFNVA